MKNTLKLISAAALVAATSTAVMANDVPLNTTVSGGQGVEKVEGQAAGGLLGLSGMAVVAGLTVLVVVAASDSNTD